VWGEINTLGGRELYRAQQVVPEAKFSAHMRYRSGLTTEMRLRKITTVGEEVTVNLTLNILNVADADTRGIELFCLCTEADQ
jgi:SPP1 family predicted phage head-tail adaptor